MKKKAIYGLGAIFIATMMILPVSAVMNTMNAENNQFPSYRGVEVVKVKATLHQNQWNIQEKKVL